jgi:hypothetical protein
MAEVEIHHHGSAHSDDPAARKVGLLVGIIGVVLAVVTIAAHREHTAAVLHRSEANDQWAYYQAKKIREHTSETAAELATALGGDAARVAAALQKFKDSAAKYAADAEEIRKVAESKDHDTEHGEGLALRFDLGEGFLELGLVLTSLFFLGRQPLFPWAGGIAGVIGLLTALSAALI